MQMRIALITYPALRTMVSDLLLPLNNDDDSHEKGEETIVELGVAKCVET